MGEPRVAKCFLCHSSLGQAETPSTFYFILFFNDILPPTTVITDYAIGLKKLSANGQYFVGAQITVSL